uniref:Zinc finger protein 398-like isoform X1 n=1 Tax=Geotrypetes seraphini TaxID=260995 RepID=A0A6P8SN42_GEOSA|nr:zinc finger protein 398-like isoform X1 [Geotrypetes seraphini]
MAAPISDLASVIFHDVAVYFSSEEWEILTDWQKELYKNVMREIHGTLVALGYTIVNRSTLLRVKEKTEAWRRRDRNKPSPTSTTSYPSVKPDIYLRIEREDTACPWTQQDSGCPVFDPKLSLWIKQENVMFSDEEQILEKEEGNKSLSSSHIGSPAVEPDLPQLMKWEKDPSPAGQQNLAESLGAPGTARPSAQPEVPQENKQQERPHLQTRCNSEGKKCLSKPLLWLTPRGRALQRCRQGCRRGKRPPSAWS